MRSALISPHSVFADKVIDEALSFPKVRNNLFEKEQYDCKENIANQSIDLFHEAVMDALTKTLRELHDFVVYSERVEDYIKAIEHQMRRSNEDALIGIKTIISIMKALQKTEINGFADTEDNIIVILRILENKMVEIRHATVWRAMEIPGIFSILREFLRKNKNSHLNASPALLSLVGSLVSENWNSFNNVFLMEPVLWNVCDESMKTGVPISHHMNARAELLGFNFDTASKKLESASSHPLLHFPPVIVLELVSWNEDADFQGFLPYFVHV